MSSYKIIFADGRAFKHPYSGEILIIDTKAAAIKIKNRMSKSFMIKLKIVEIKERKFL